MHCVKRLGRSLMARDFDRKVAELQVRAAALNGYTVLGSRTGHAQAAGIIKMKAVETDVRR